MTLTPHQAQKIAALSAVTVLFLIKPLFGICQKKQEKILAALLGILSAYSLFAYVEFGSFHPLPNYGNQNFHWSEMYHYYVGSKYFKETGVFDLYNCSFIAMQELRSEHPESLKDLPSYDIRNLHKKFEAISPSQASSEFGAYCHEKFSPNRWDLFKKDLHFFINSRPDDWALRGLLFDAGYNSSPAYAVVAGAVANLFPLERCWEFLGYLDFILIGMAALFIYRRFGWIPLFGFLAVYGLTPLGTYEWVGGVFLKTDMACFLNFGSVLSERESFFYFGNIFWVLGGGADFPGFFCGGSFGAACLSIRES